MPSKEILLRQLLQISIATLITVVIWVGYGVYSALTKPSEVNVTKEELLALPGEISDKGLIGLRERMVLDESDLSNFEISIRNRVVIEEPTPTPASPSARLPDESTEPTSTPSASSE